MIRIQKYKFLIFIFILFILVLINFSSALAYGRGIYGRGQYGIGYAISGGTPTFSSSQSQLKEGYTKSLYKNWKIEFEFENETYLITLKDINNKIAKISVSQIQQTFNLAVNETKKLNLNDDKFYDLEIFLKDITATKADLIVKFIYEEISFEEVIKEKQPEEGIEKRIKGLWILIGIVLAVGIVTVLFIIKFKGKVKKKGRKGRYSKI